MPHWQALCSLVLNGVKQQHVEAAATLTQLTSLVIQSATEPLSMSCLGPLTALRSLDLHAVKLAAPGLSLVAQQCSSLTQLKLSLVGRDPFLPPCSWPALLELQLVRVHEGVVNHVLPTPATASLLARLGPVGELLQQLPHIIRPQRVVPVRAG